MTEFSFVVADINGNKTNLSSGQNFATSSASDVSGNNIDYTGELPGQVSLYTQVGGRLVPFGSAGKIFFLGGE